MQIILDPGHPSHRGDRGVSRDGFDEADFTLAIACETQNILRGLGAGCALTRDRDAVTPFAVRRQRADAVTGALVIALHADNATNPAHRGMRALYWPQDPYLRRCAKTVLSFAPGALRRRRIPTAADVRWTRVQNVLQALGEDRSILVEVGYASNPVDRAYMMSDRGRQQIALGLAQACLEIAHHSTLE